MNYNDKHISIVMVGHVDHGKSTIIGRLLAETNSLPEGKLKQVQDTCEKNSKPFEYAFLLDALKDEQSQGITIDTARIFFKSKIRNYIILDAPGHTEFIKNMITGASRADAAFLVVDANEGVKENTKRHAVLLSMLGVTEISILVNKMDLINYNENEFLNIKKELGEFLSELDIQPISYIPVSGFIGDNMISPSENIPWYKGDTVLEALDNFKHININQESNLRIPLQDVYKFTENKDTRRIVAGKISSGSLRESQEIIFFPSHKKCKVKTIEEFNNPNKSEAINGESVGFTLDKEFYLKRGEIVASARGLHPKVSDRIIVKLFWLNREPMVMDKKYTFKLGTCKVHVTIEQINYVVNTSTLVTSKKSFISTNEACECILRLSTPIAFDIAENIKETSRFVLSDNYVICGGGLITKDLEPTFNLHKRTESNFKKLTWSNGLISYDDRCNILNQKGLVVWFIGLPSSGKSTLAIELEKELTSQKKLVYRLDGDNVRHGLNMDLGFDESDRVENIRRVAEVANLFRDSGIITLVSFICPLESMRELIIKIIGSENLFLVYTKASLNECIKRDVKGLYKMALNGEIENFTGISSSFEEPTSANLVIETDKLSIEESVRELLEYINFDEKE